MNTNDNTVPMRYVNRLLEKAKLAGCDPQKLLEEVALPSALYDEQWHEAPTVASAESVGDADADFGSEEEISAEKYGELYQLVMRDTQDEWFGMFVGGKVPLGALRMMCLTLVHCKDLRQAVSRAGEFSEICRGMKTRIRLDTDDKTMTMKLSPVHFVSDAEFSSLVESALPEQILTSLLTWHRFTEWLVDKELKVEKIQVTFSEDEMKEPYVYLGSEKIEFQQAFNGVVYDRRVLELPVVQNEHAMMDFLRTAPAKLVAKNAAHIRFSEKVENILKKDVSRLMPSSEQVAKRLNVSVTTMRRRLQEDNTSFQRIKDKCRMDAAFHYLSCMDLSNSDIAERLGFDEPSAFFRSFKKWTGKTPGEYRADLSVQRRSLLGEAIK